MDSRHEENAVDRPLRKNRRRDAFRAAVLRSLNELVNSGKTITKKAIIENASNNGRGVCAKALYARHPGTGEYVHGALLHAINQAIEGNREKKGRSSTGELSRLRQALGSLKAERDSLVDQVVEQEARLYAAEGHRGQDKHIIESQEEEIYVLARVANHLAGEAVRDFSEIVRRFEQKYRNMPEKVALAKNSADRYIEEISSQRQPKLAGLKIGPKGTIP